MMATLGAQAWKGKFEKDRRAFVYPTQTDHMEKWERNPEPRSCHCYYLNMFYGLKVQIKLGVCSQKLQLHF